MPGSASPGRLPLFVAVSILLNFGIAHALGNLPEEFPTLPKPAVLKISLSAEAAPPPPPPSTTLPDPVRAAAVPLPIETVESAAEKMTATPVTAPEPLPAIVPPTSEPVIEHVESPAPVPEKPSKLAELRLPKKPALPRPKADEPAKPDIAEAPPQEQIVQEPAQNPPAAVETAAVGNGTSNATIIHNAKYRRQTSPVYPRRAYELGQQGTVLLFTEVLPNGRPGEIEVAESSGHRLLDMSALAAVKSWEFEPVTVDGVVASTWVRVPVRFVIR